MKFPQPPLHADPIAGVLSWVQWFSQIVSYFFVEAAIAPTLATGWTNFGGGFREAEYWKDNATGMVQIEGLVNYATGTPTTNTPIFTLPVGYRPNQIITFTVGSATTSAAHTIARCDIQTNGNVNYVNGSFKYYFQLNNISFRAYQ